MSQDTATLKALVSSEKLLFESRKDFFNQLLDKKESCRKRVAWVSSWWDAFLKLEQNLDRIADAIEKEAKSIFYDIDGTNQQEVIESYKSILENRLNDLSKFYEAERVYWKLIRDNIDLTLQNDIRQCKESIEKLKEVCQLVGEK